MNLFAKNLLEPAYLHCREKDGSDEIRPKAVVTAGDLARAIMHLWAAYRNHWIDQQAVMLVPWANLPHVEALQDMLFEHNFYGYLERVVPDSYGWEGVYLADDEEWIDDAELRERSLWQLGYMIACCAWMIFEGSELCPLAEYEPGELEAWLVNRAKEEAGLRVVKQKRGIQLVQSVMEM